MKNAIARCAIVATAIVGPLAGCAPADLEALVLDKLICADVVRPSTVDRLRHVLREPDANGLADLLLDPADLASMIARGGPQLEGAVVVAKNLRQLVDSGAGADLLAHGWDGVQCDEPHVVACTAGSMTSSVGCTGGQATDIVLAFEGCVLGGQKKDGAVQLSRDLDGEVATFDIAVVDDETRVMQGAGLLDIGRDDAFTFALTDGFAVVDHGGPDAGLSCGAELRLTEAGFDLDDDTATFNVSLTKDTVDDHFALATTRPVVFDGDCGCPRPGASIVMDVPRPVGRDGETAHAQIAWSASDDDNACARVDVTLSDWPTSCAVGGDCGKAATATALTTLLSAFCAVP